MANRLVQFMNDERVRYWAMFTVCLLACGATLWPVLGTGFMADDAMNSLTTRAVLSSHGSNVVKFASDFTGDWARKQGRFFPGASFVFFLFWTVDGNLALYKAIQLSAILLDIGLFGLLVTQLVGSRNLGVAAMAISVVMLQDTMFHDAIVSFGTLLQVDFALVTGALLLFLLYLRKRRPWQFWASVAMYVAALLTYEVIAAMAVLFPLAAWLYGKRRKPREIAALSWPYVAAVGCAVVATIGLRIAFGNDLLAHSGDATYSLSLAPTKVLPTLAKQVYAALPMTFELSSTAHMRDWTGVPFGSVAYDLRTYPVTSLIIFAAIAILTAWPLWRASDGISRDSRPIRLTPLVAFGLAYIALPALVISLSPRWQRELVWGAGYLPVYIEYFGVAMLLLGASYALLRAIPNKTARRGMVVALACLVGVAGAVNFQNNRVVLETQNVTWKYPRTALRLALEHGLASDAMSGDCVLTMQGALFESPDFFYSAAGFTPSWVKGVDTLTPTLAKSLGRPAKAEVARGVTYDLRPSRRAVWWVLYGATAQDNGVAAACRVLTITFVDGKVSSMTVKPSRVFARASTGSASSRDSFSGSPLEPAEVPSPSSLGVDEGAGRVIGGTSDWVLYAMPTTQVLRFKTQ